MSIADNTLEEKVLALSASEKRGGAASVKYHTHPDKTFKEQTPPPVHDPKDSNMAPGENGYGRDDEQGKAFI